MVMFIITNHMAITLYTFTLPTARPPHANKQYPPKREGEAQSGQKGSLPKH